MDQISCLFLDSGGGWFGKHEKAGTFMRFGQPKGTFCAEGGVVTINTASGRVQTNRDPLTILEGFLSEGYIAAGYIGYEYSTFTDSDFTPERIKEGDRYPDLKFHLYSQDDMVSGDISDFRRIVGSDIAGTAGILDSPNHLLSPPKSNMSRDEYIDMVETAKGYIRDGDIYQINLSQRFTIDSRLSPVKCFLRMFHVQQVPFGCYIDFGDFQLCSGSMELYLRRRGGVLTTGPIKGTVERGLNPESDTIKKAKLVSSEKERAENLMIVDLMRNDLSRVSRAGSVRVTRLFDVETYATLHQLVSEVEGRLANGIGVSGIIKNTFPPGSVTGAPKRRVLQLIDMLEPHRRGPYCGAAGVFFPDGDFTLSVGIRLLISDPGKATFWVGGGIVWDSDPVKEYEETLLKSMAINKALGLHE
ncbi:MAG TPA: anthranilate synthase component I family protein [Thermodesulfobacteriota bacterium]|nr:anthranilate synthase component I family protein [Thermodesulfobacteriota bacterium]